MLWGLQIRPFVWAMQYLQRGTTSCFSFFFTVFFICDFHLLLLLVLLSLEAADGVHCDQLLLLDFLPVGLER